MEFDDEEGDDEGEEMDMEMDADEEEGEMEESFVREYKEKVAPAKGEDPGKGHGPSC